MKLGPLATALPVVVMVLAGCAGPNAFRNVDLSKGLSAGDVQRYESEWRALRQSGHAEGMATLEHSNWWPLGLLIYHKDASVMRMPGPNGPTYTVMSGHGFGPLSVLYARATSATYDGDGRRMSWMRMRNALVGHLAMSHESEAQLADGREEKTFSAHLLHHLFSVHKMNGHTYVSLLTIPNPIGVTFSGHPAAPPAP
jgi:hypothetical protein